MQIGYFARRLAAALGRAAASRARAAKSVTAPPAVARDRRDASRPATLNADGTVLATDGLTVHVRRARRGQRRRLPRRARRGRSGSSATTAPASRRCSTRSAATCRAAARCSCSGATSAASAPHHACRARARPHVPSRDAVPRADGARDGAARARSAAPHVVLGLADLAAVDPARARQARARRPS